MIAELIGPNPPECAKSHSWDDVCEDCVEWYKKLRPYEEPR